MLSDLARPVIEATLPYLDSRLGEIATRFGRKMSAAQPELPDGGAGRGNRANTDPYAALVGTIEAFAMHIVERPDSLPEAVLTQIAHLRSPLGIAEDEYQTMYPYLFEAISEEMGSALTPDVGAAWSEVYWLMADALVRIKEGMHNDHANYAWAPWRIIGKTTAGASTVQFVLEPAGATPASRSLPGQFVSVRVIGEHGTVQTHRYPLARGTRAVGRRVFSTEYNDGSGVSAILHEKIQVGDVLELSDPVGKAILEESKRPLVLASAGAGGAASASLLRSLANVGSGREVLVLHADRSLDAWALGDQILADIEKLGNVEMHLWCEEPEAGTCAGAITAHEGIMSLSEIELPEDADLYVCGPVPFMQKIRSEAISLAVPAQRIRYEVVAPDRWFASAS